MVFLFPSKAAARARRSSSREVSDFCASATCTARRASSLRVGSAARTRSFSLALPERTARWRISVVAGVSCLARSSVTIGAAKEPSPAVAKALKISQRIEALTAFGQRAEIALSPSACLLAQRTSAPWAAGRIAGGQFGRKLFNALSASLPPSEARDWAASEAMAGFGEVNLEANAGMAEASARVASESMRPSVHAGWSAFSRAFRSGADAAGSGLFCRAQRAPSRMRGVESESRALRPGTEEAEARKGNCPKALRREGCGAAVSEASARRSFSKAAAVAGSVPGFPASKASWRSFVSASKRFVKSGEARFSRTSPGMAACAAKAVARKRVVKRCFISVVD